MPVLSRKTAVSSANVKLIEVDLGLIPVSEATFFVLDQSVTTSSLIQVNMSGITPTGKDADEVSMDSFMLLATPMSGKFKLYIRGLEGSIHGKFKVVYSVG